MEENILTKQKQYLEKKLKGGGGRLMRKPADSKPVTRGSNPRRPANY